MILRKQFSRRSLLRSMTAAGASLFLPQYLTASQEDGLHIIEARQAEFPLLGNSATPVNVWAYSGSIPGPEIRVKQGKEVRVKLINKLNEPTTIHWHGIRIRNDMDGVPNLTQKPVEPGDSFEYRFVAPDAGTFWYHTHNRSWEQMAKGLYGSLIVDESEPQSFDKDLILIIDDWRINDEGQIDTESFGNIMDHSHAGRYGNWITVNGMKQPVFSVPSAKITRLRLINTCNSRILKLKIPEMDTRIIAIDGQPIVPTRLHNQELIIAPAGRMDLAVQPTQNSLNQLDLLLVGNSRSGNLKIASFQIMDTGKSDKVSPNNTISLPSNPLSTDLDIEQAVRVSLKMEGGAMGRMGKAIYKGEPLDIRELVRLGQVWAFNGVVGRTSKPLLEAQKGQTVVIDIMNETAWPHAMHLHGHHFQVVEQNRQSILKGPWIDTMLMAERESSSIAFVADNPGKWLFHCHMLEHQVSGMTTWIHVKT